jgi:hypothetical protein
MAMAEFPLQIPAVRYLWLGLLFWPEGAESDLSAADESDLAPSGATP